ncbi:MAG TPA: hypothetical protein VMU57_15800 [Edaphobacter sp.]|uniref:hypothetical protein n=1 Tax=Edaphobacter sp. TaxID=1934404 RepID=UPI002C289B62|nr:hypothetical protein [Edaphobacter sp.]HUZ96367.1 hypothetical protein [Edaphobacter sp.]
MSHVQAQLEQSQRELAELRQQLVSLQASVGVSNHPAGPSTSESNGAADLAAAVAEIREAQAMQETQIATLDQSKVESASKYPVRLSGMVLFNGFVNTRRVDAAATPSVALSGPGSTGLSARQTIVGLDIDGPHVLGARTHGDVRLDMSASASGSGYTGSYALGLVRLRTAHLDLNWSSTHAFFALDRPLISPETPSSLTAIAVPPLAWSGNLWVWNPQAGLSYDAFTSGAGSLRVQAALIDTADPPPLFSNRETGSYVPPSTGEISRWPGIQTRVAFESSNEDSGARFGIGGYFAPHRTSNSLFTFDSWAGAADFRIPVSRFMQFSGSAYWGSALGGLGGGAYKDYVALNSEGEDYYRVLDDRGGWVQWKQKTGERLEFNEAFGIDNVPAGQLRPYAIPTPVSIYNLARNRTFTSNVIFSPSAYLLFSLEYRRIMTSYVTAPSAFSDVIGVAAGYKF